MTVDKNYAKEIIISDEEIDEAELVNSYTADFDETSFWKKLGKDAAKLGSKGTYLVLLLYYALRSNAPAGIKVLILAAIAYFIAPFDAVPDWIPVAGFADDLTVLLFTKHKIEQYVDEETRSKAETKLLELKEVIK